MVDFKTIKGKYGIKSKGYRFIFAKTRNYKRMLLIDQKRLFFAEERGGERTFFFTSDITYIKKFSHYFEKESAIVHNHDRLMGLR